MIRGSKPGVIWDSSGLARFRGRLRTTFMKKYGLRAMRQSSSMFERMSKQQIEMNESIRTGNLINSTEAIESKVIKNGREVTGGVIAGSAIPQPDNPDDKVEPSESYADLVEKQKPYIAPSLSRVTPYMKTTFIAAHSAFARVENARKLNRL